MKDERNMMRTDVLHYNDPDAMLGDAGNNGHLRCSVERCTRFEQVWSVVYGVLVADSRVMHNNSPGIHGRLRLTKFVNGLSVRNKNKDTKTQENTLGTRHH